MITVATQTKNSITISNDTKVSDIIIQDDDRQIADVEDAIDNLTTPFTNQAKNSISITNETK